MDKQVKPLEEMTDEELEQLAAAVDLVIAQFPHGTHENIWNHVWSLGASVESIQIQRAEEGWHPDDGQGTDEEMMRHFISQGYCTRRSAPEYLAGYRLGAGWS